MPVTDEFIDAAWLGEPDAVAQLVTITSDADPEPIRASDCSERLLPGRRQGIVSNGVEYPFYPFQLAWAGASRSSPFGEGRLTIQNVDRRIEEACDAALQPPRVDLAVVRIEAPNVVETAIAGARIPAVEGDESRVVGIVRPRDFSQEPAVAWNYTPAKTPGQF